MAYYNIHTHAQANHHEEIAIISVDVSKTFKLCENARNYHSVGIHPWSIDIRFPKEIRLLFNKVSELAKFPKIVAIGETGIDKNTAKSATELIFQQEIFLSHARLSEALKKPLIIHCVKAWSELLQLRQSFKPSMIWIIHGFRGKLLLAEQMLNAGFYLSFGMCYHVDALKAAWVKRHLFLETDDSGVDIRNVYRQVASDLSISEYDLMNEIQVLSSQFSVLSSQK